MTEANAAPLHTGPLHTGPIHTGVYTIAEASGLTGVSSQTIRRWLGGTRAVLGGQLPNLDGHVALGFLDLIEVRFVAHFLRQGVKWKTLRAAVENARSAFGHAHPFATRYVSDGARIFEHAAGQDDAHLRDLANNQYAFYDFLVNAFREGIEFDTEGTACRWRPEPLESPDVVLDPQRSFGRPVLVVSGVPTAALRDALRAEGSADAVAKWFDIPKSEVEQALRFEALHGLPRAA